VHYKVHTCANKLNKSNVKKVSLQGTAEGRMRVNESYIDREAGYRVTWSSSKVKVKVHVRRRKNTAKVVGATSSEDFLVERKRLLNLNFLSTVISFQTVRPIDRDHGRAVAY